MRKTTFFLVLLLLCSAVSAASVKNVAVVETEIDEESGASELISAAEVRLVTVELRREAVKNLPQKKYNVMTTETVMAQGTAVLLECAEENCVISLGGKIGADFIVRGHISRIDTKLALSVDVYDTEDGNLVASSEAVRAEKVADLLEAAAAVCAEMYKSFVTAHAEAEAPPSAMQKFVKNTSVGGGGFFAGDFGGGLVWGNNERLAMPYYGGGAYLFLDFVYAELSAGYSMGGGTWESGDASTLDSLPNMPRSYINVGFFAKYPFEAGNAKIFPLLGIDYEASVSGKRVYRNGKEYTLDYSTSAAWFKLGGGAEIGLGKSAYWRVEALYGVRTANLYEEKLREKESEYNNSVKTGLGNGVTVRTGVGIKF
jgi:hypothetical protein